MGRLFLVSFLLLASMPAMALFAHFPFSNRPNKILLEKVDRIYDRNAKQNERVLINEAFQEYFKKARPGEIFRAQKFRKMANSIEESELNQSWKDEAALALEGKPVPKVIYLRGNEDLYSHFYANSPIAIAKKYARAQMYDAIQKNWDSLKTTLVNDHVIDCPIPKKCNALDADLMEKFAARFFFNYDKTKQYNNGNYIFEFQDIGKVEVNNQTLNSGQVIFEVGDDHDLNETEKGSERYRTDVDAGLAPPPSPATAPENEDSPKTNGQ